MPSRISERFDRLIEGRGGGHATTTDAIDGRLRDMNGHQQEQLQLQKQQQLQQQQNGHDGKGGRQNGAVVDKENRGSSVYIADKSSGKGGKSKDKVKSNMAGHFLSIRG